MSINIEKMETEKRVLIRCECGCGIIEFCQWDFKDWHDITISYYPLGFYGYQRVWLEKLKAIWKILTGQYYSFFDVTVMKEEFEEKIRKFMD